MLSRRTGWNLAGNRLAARLDAARSAGRPLLDLAESNPTRAGLAWPADALGAALSDPRIAAYDPEPRGLPAAREAVAAYLAARGHAVDPGRIVLTASTSEGYALLLKLLCDPGDEVLVPAPSYPLLDLLADLESVRLVRYPLRYDGAWHLDVPALEAAVTASTRAVVVVSPSNPTGAVLGAAEREAIDRLCAARDLALVGDEVFADTALVPPAGVLGASRALAFHLSGLSKVCGLPQVKAAWIAAGGPEAPVAAALERLEVIADAYLSISGPAQLALPRLLADRERFLGPLRARLAANRAALAAAASGAPFDALPSAGGWSAVLRIGETIDEEGLCLALLDDGVAVQPGFFYDFERAGHLVVSLLAPPDAFAAGLARVRDRVARAAAGIWDPK
ncbi:pyridoxal phosphate-dependent aminotransferase [Anaeromyxobacter oryzae]|uniref:alanine transaminase n=1 Tax=Anaeromyxobacter oryzae TaxID=2918170 RepID=A0ABN6MVB9_9BACT|nr:pyridoxal phosphate-dependent aminotransferase [Anaeromyxobacter oryzae]BDG04907.1 aminotransferase [Anaeromyxobacter oryzae]